MGGVAQKVSGCSARGTRRLYTQEPMTPAVRLTKRGIDLAASVFGLTVASPVMAAIAVLVKVDSPGPVFYKQRRSGRLKRGYGGTVECEEFTVYKFRTMRTDAESISGPVLAQEHDPRVTRVGSFLRKSRLDELPQLVNILMGDMSLVGPRPERPVLLQQLSATIPMFEERVRDIKPGLTGFSQVNLSYSGKPRENSEAMQHLRGLTNPFGLDEAEGAVADDMRIKLLYDLAYAAACERMSTYLPMELGVIAKTPWIMLRGLGR